MTNEGERMFADNPDSHVHFPVSFLDPAQFLEVDPPSEVRIGSHSARPEARQRDQIMIRSTAVD